MTGKKLKDILKGREEWENLGRFIRDIEMIGSQTKDPFALLVGIKLLELLADLAEVEIENEQTD